MSGVHLCEDKGTNSVDLQDAAPLNRSDVDSGDTTNDAAQAQQMVNGAISVASWTACLSVTSTCRTSMACSGDRSRSDFTSVSDCAGLALKVASPERPCSRRVWHTSRPRVPVPPVTMAFPYTENLPEALSFGLRCEVKGGTGLRPARA